MTRIRGIATLAAALVFGGFPLQTAGVEAEVDADAGCPSPAGEVHEEGFVSIGGIEQWVTIQGESCANPVILFLHGGPGNPLSPYADSIYGSWKKAFTLVQWDQRGAGRTYGHNAPPAGSALTVERMVEDGVALAEYLTRHLGTKKVILVGGSWGSILGVHMTVLRPDLFHAYVGSAQVVSYRENQAASYLKVVGLARAAGDRATVEALEALGPPPWSNPRSPGILRRATRAYEAETSAPAPESWWVRAPGYDTPQLRADSLEGEDFSYLQFVGLEGDGMFSTVDLRKLGTAFEVPVFLVQGAEDLVTVPDVTRRYFDGISAPRAELVVVPRAGHDPNPALIDATYEILTQRVRPLATGGSRR